MRTSGWKCPTSSAVITSMRPSPNALYESASRLSSAKRSGPCAMLTLPTSRKPGGLSGLRFELGQEAAGVGAELGVGVAGPRGADEPRRVPARAGGELPALQKHDVGPSELRQVVGDARASDPASDDHCARAFRQRPAHDGLPPVARAGGPARRKIQGTIASTSCVNGRAQRRHGSLRGSALRAQRPQSAAITAEYGNGGGISGYGYGCGNRARCRRPMPPRR